jgi:hypothetical protein
MNCKECKKDNCICDEDFDLGVHCKECEKYNCICDEDFDLGVRECVINEDCESCQ